MTTNDKSTDDGGVKNASGREFVTQPDEDEEDDDE